MANVGESQADARASINAIFEALPKSKKMEFLGELNEVLIYIDRHPPKLEE
jgi:hypothetical protein